MATKMNLRIAKSFVASIIRENSVYTINLFITESRRQRVISSKDQAEVKGMSSGRHSKWVQLNLSFKRPYAAANMFEQ